MCIHDKACQSRSPTTSSLLLALTLSADEMGAYQSKPRPRQPASRDKDANHLGFKLKYKPEFTLSRKKHLPHSNYSDNASRASHVQRHSSLLRNIHKERQDIAVDISELESFEQAYRKRYPGKKRGDPPKSRDEYAKKWKAIDDNFAGYCKLTVADIRRRTMHLQKSIGDTRDKTKWYVEDVAMALSALCAILASASMS